MRPMRKRKTLQELIQEKNKAKQTKIDNNKDKESSNQRNQENTDQAEKESANQNNQESSNQKNKTSSKQKKRKNSSQSNQSSNQSNQANKTISSDISQNEETVKDLFQNCSDFVSRTININGKIKVLLAYIDGLTDTKVMEEMLLKPIIFEGLPQGIEESHSIGKMIQQQLVAVSQIKTVTEMKKLVDGI
jgi:DNA mismatch repair ATPase MutL